MSEEGGEEVKNGDVNETTQEQSKTPEPLSEPPISKGIEYDEDGKMKPYICICPPKPPDDDDLNDKDVPTENGQTDDKPKESKTDTVDEETAKDDAKEPTKDDKQTKDENTKDEAKTSPTAVTDDSKNLNKSFSEQFKLFSKFGDTKSDGRLLSLSQSDKWMKQAKVIDGKHITTTDTGIHFKKLKSLKVSETEYKKFLEDLAKTRKVNVDDLKKKMIACGSPGLTSTTSGSKTPSAVERLTDPSKYTGSHRQRFDESGKGRGIAGRKDLHDNSGYVSGYQNKNTYDRKNPTK